jgi:hypothetical protein
MSSRAHNARAHFGLGPRMLSLLTTIVVAGSGQLAAPRPAIAAPIPYALSGATAFFVGSPDTLTGTFTSDPAGPTLEAVDITVTGPFDPGDYTIPIQFMNAIRVNAEATNVGADGTVLTLTFTNPLDLVPDPIMFAQFSDLATGGGIVATSVTGAADPQVPEPSSAALLGGVVALFLLGRRAARHPHGARPVPT